MLVCINPCSWREPRFQEDFRRGRWRGGRRREGLRRTQKDLGLARRSGCAQGVGWEGKRGPSPYSAKPSVGTKTWPLQASRTVWPGRPTQGAG